LALLNLTGRWISEGDLVAVNRELSLKQIESGVYWSEDRGRVFGFSELAGDKPDKSGDLTRPIPKNRTPDPIAGFSHWLLTSLLAGLQMGSAELAAR